MRAFYLVLMAAILLLAACSPAKRYYKKGNYHMAVVKSVEKLRKKSDSEKEIEILRKAYPNANRKDRERISYLKKEGSPDRWEEVFEKYNILKKRQSLVRTIVPLRYDGGTLDFPVKDYDNEIIAAKRNAAEFLYAHASDLLRKNNRFDARKAYYELQKVKQYFPVYSDVDELLPVAKDKGTSKVHITVKDNTIFKLPPKFKSSLIPEDLSRINTQWIEYTSNAKRKSIDYKAEIRLEKIIITPSKVDSKEYIKEKKVKDGWEYVLDENGNVKKDSLGNDIKIPKYKTLKCVVKETVQCREISLSGSIVYTYIDDYRVVRKAPILAGYTFENIYATANGNLSILDENILELLKRKPVSIPLDFDMIFTAGDILKRSIYDALHANRKVPD